MPTIMGLEAKFQYKPMKVIHIQSLWRWGVIAIVVMTALFLGLAEDQAKQRRWKTQRINEGALPAGVCCQDTVRVIKLLALSEEYISYVQNGRIVWLDYSLRGRWFRAQVNVAEVPVISTKLKIIRIGPVLQVCVIWQEQAGGVKGVKKAKKRCGRVSSPIEWLSDPIDVSPEDAIAGQHDFGGEWSGSLDIAMDEDGTDYVVWAQDYDSLVVAKSTDSVTTHTCGYIPDQTGVDVRFPTIHADEGGRVWVATAQTARSSDIRVWVSHDHCYSWEGPVNVTSNPGFSDAPSITSLGSTIFIVNDDDFTNPSSADLMLHVSRDGGISWTSSVIVKNAFWPDIDSDGHRGIYIVFQDEHSGNAGFICSADGGYTWLRDDIPDSKPNTLGFRDPDFGLTVSRNQISVSEDGIVSVAWMTRQGNEVSIMLSTREGGCY